MQNEELSLEFCSSSNAAFKGFEDRHYVEKIPAFADMSELEQERVSKTPERLARFLAKEGKRRGHHGQQIHFLIWYKGQNVGAISGGSAIYGNASRDRFFGINKDNKRLTLNGIIDNTLFRLEQNERNLATRCLSLWRRVVPEYWMYLYDVAPYGFETFVDENAKVRPGKTRDGGIYRADNWTYLGRTIGSTKNHIGVGLTGGVEYQGPGSKKGTYARTKTTPKLMFVKWIPGFSSPQFCEYLSSWRGKTFEEKILAKERARRRERCMGTFAAPRLKELE
jgi:hypothetical protein